MLGEAWQGSARGCENAGFLALGTGIGLGLIINGKLARGATGAAGEIAYLPIGPDTRSGEARHIGAFELEVGTAGILRRYRSGGGDSTVTTVREIFARLDSKDAVAETVIDETARLLALAITALHAFFDPEIVVLGGSIGIRAELIERVRAQMPLVYDRPVSIRASDLGSRAALVGAVSSAMSRLHAEVFGIPNLPGALAVPGTALAKAAE
jgi:predicted NBD/HSP70 family sugar kinase